MNTEMDEDALQEYACLLLEGVDDEEAERLARKASARYQSEHVGPLHFHYRTKGGKAVYRKTVTIPAYFDYVDHHPMTLDEREPWEVDADFDKRDRDRERLEYLLDRAGSPKRMQYLRMRFGLDGEPMRNPEIAKELGVALRTVEDGVWNGMKALKRAAAKPQETPAQIRKRHRQRDAQRKSRSKA